MTLALTLKVRGKWQTETKRSLGHVAMWFKNAKNHVPYQDFVCIRCKDGFQVDYDTYICYNRFHKILQWANLMKGIKDLIGLLTLSPNEWVKFYKWINSADNSSWWGFCILSNIRWTIYFRTNVVPKPTTCTCFEDLGLMFPFERSLVHPIWIICFH